MRDVLHKIAANKRVEVEELKIEHPLRDLFKQTERPSNHAFKHALNNADETSIIAEIKRGSPSKGIFREDFNPAQLAQSYARGGASALSVITDTKYFYGKFEYVRLAKEESALPVLCKDFVIDPYQIHYARFKQADAVLLIVRLLSPADLQAYLELAREADMDCLVEVHNAEEVNIAVDCGAEIIGVNNRDLSDFTVRLETCEELSPLIPTSVIKVAESGIFGREHIDRLQASGYSCFLIGEALVTSEDPVTLIRSLRGA